MLTQGERILWPVSMPVCLEPSYLEQAKVRKASASLLSSQLETTVAVFGRQEEEDCEFKASLKRRDDRFVAPL